jgi:RimJ/RimL family protein N-acetyltransferase
MKTYVALNKQTFSNGKYSIVPIRAEDRFSIMKWRNEQAYHLRTKEVLTAQVQDEYFNNTVASLFEKTNPDQLLFSYLEGDCCIGYGGLVHINWASRNAEISFLMNTALEDEHFNLHWSTFLSLIEEVAFSDLGLHKVYTYAFDLRKHLYDVLESCHYNKEAVLVDHHLVDGRFIYVVIHAKINNAYVLRKAKAEDIKLTFAWASDPIVRRYSFDRKKIEWEAHKRWFLNKIKDPDCEFYLLVRENLVIGSIRFDMDNNGTATVSYLIDPKFHGKGLGKLILEFGLKQLKIERPEIVAVHGSVINENISSYRIFERLGFSKAESDNFKTKFKKDF